MPIPVCDWDRSGEQVLAKPKRKVRSVNQRAFVSRWVGWILHPQRRTPCGVEEEGLALKSAVGQGCRSFVKATSDSPNPRDTDETNPLSERGTKSL